MTLYLSGPMRGYPNFNFPLFHEVTRDLRAQGHHVFNPAAHDEAVYPTIQQWPGFASGDTEQCPEFDLPTSLAWDFARILDSDGIVMLPGWEKSSGAKAERFVAECIGLRTFTAIRFQGEQWTLIPNVEKKINYPTLKEAS